MNSINVTNEDLLILTEDASITFNKETKIIIKSNNNLIITINSNVELILLSDKKINLSIVVNRHAKLELTNINFNSKEIILNADLLDGSYFDSNFILLSKNYCNIKQNVNHIGRDSYSMINNKIIAFSKSNVEIETIGSIKNGIKFCNCNQLTRGLILESDAIINATPILLIDECEVKAYHGATIGNINEEDLFYIMSRGLNKIEAFNLIVNGLFKPYFEKIFIEEEKSKIDKKYLSFFR